MPSALITAYCACSICCGPHSGPAVTASGKRPVEGVTIAGPKNIPFNTKVIITLPSGRRIIRTVQDHMARKYDGRWDIYFHSHKAAKEFGIQKGEVVISK